MSEIANEIVQKFKAVSKSLVEDMIQILEICEGDFRQVQGLEKYGQLADRIMGGAQSLAYQIFDKKSPIHRVGDYAALCKAVSYKAAKIEENQDFYEICVALLMDATETLEKMIDCVGEKNAIDFTDFITTTFLERLKWVSAQFDENVKEEEVPLEDKKDPIQSKKLNQDEINDLLRKMGLE